MARRKSREVAKRGLIETANRGFGKNLGRPESVVSLRTRGLKYLSHSGIINSKISMEDNAAISSNRVDHQLSLNWTRLHLLQVEKECNGLALNFLSPSLNSGIYRIGIDNSKIEGALIPDGIFLLTHSKQGKTLLFFLEIDMGT